MLKLDAKQRKAFDRSKVSKPMGKSKIIATRLEKEFMGFDDTFSFTYEPKQGDSAWHPSGDCTPSVTELYTRAIEWQIMHEFGAKAEPTTKKLVNQKQFLIGHYWHQLIQYICVSRGWVDASSIERSGHKAWRGKDKLPKIPNKNDFEAFHWVHGQGDIVPYTNDGWTGLIDIKTTRSMTFNTPGLPSSFAEKYICQANVYMDLFDQEQCLFLMVNKDDGAFKEITFVRNQPLIDAIYQKWFFVSDCLDRDIVPTEEDNEKYALPPITENDEQD